MAQPTSYDLFRAEHGKDVDTAAEFFEGLTLGLRGRKATELDSPALAAGIEAAASYCEILTDQAVGLSIGLVVDTCLEDLDVKVESE